MESGERLATLESTQAWIYKEIFGNGERGRLPKLEEKVEKVERLLLRIMYIVIGVMIADGSAHGIRLLAELLK